MCTELTVCGVGGGAWWARSSVLDMVLAATFAVAERGQKRVELLLDLMEPRPPHVTLKRPPRGILLSSLQLESSSAFLMPLSELTNPPVFFNTTRL